MNEQTRQESREETANYAANREPAEGSRDAAESSRGSGEQAPRGQPCDETRPFVTDHDTGDEEAETCAPGSKPASSRRPR
jgi:hypothetical protein